MTSQQIDKLISKGEFPEVTGKPILVETHISWVIIGDLFVYKVKKPIVYSFLDFSTIEKRKYYCEQEVVLNRRLTEDIYLGVLPINETGGNIVIGGEKGNIIDYAVWMRKMDSSRQMDLLLVKGKVSNSDIKGLAEIVAAFHKNTGVIYESNLRDIREKFNDLDAEKVYLGASLNVQSVEIISRAIEISNAFMDANQGLLAERLKAGFFRDCHGDLHTRNIFLLTVPIVFDCIEFNDDYRRIDVLNEVAFLCMDLDAFGRQDLSDLFLDCYNDLFPSIKTREDRRLFIYYKAYRSNIRAKVNSLRAKTAGSETEKKTAISESGKYIHLMSSYLEFLK